MEIKWDCGWRGQPICTESNPKQGGFVLQSASGRSSLLAFVSFMSCRIATRCFTLSKLSKLSLSLRGEVLLVRLFQTLLPLKDVLGLLVGLGEPQSPLSVEVKQKPLDQFRRLPDLLFSFTFVNRKHL